MRQHQSGTLLNDTEALHKHIVSFRARKIKNCAIFALVFRKEDVVWHIGKSE